jgi:hypothetical protein
MPTVNFPTRIQNYSSTAIDNIFIDNSRKDHISIEPVINGLSDHDAQLLFIKNIHDAPQRLQYDIPWERSKVSMSLYKSCKFYKITKITKKPARKTIDQLDKNSNG